MRKLLMIIAALMLLVTPVSADYLETADRAGEAPAAAVLREYVYKSGAAQDVKAEQRRLFLYNYMLNLKKQRLDYSQLVYNGIYEMSGRNQDLKHNTELAYEAFQTAAGIQEEISRNEAYLEKITDADSVTNTADEFVNRLVLAQEQPTMEEQEEEEQPEDIRVWRYIADIAAVVAILLIIALIWLCVSRIDTSNISQKKRDCLRMIHEGRYIILAAALVCAVGFGVGSVVCKRLGSEHSANSPHVSSHSASDSIPRESKGEYLADVESLDEYVVAGIKNGIDGFENIWKYEIATAYADILNDRVAKDMDKLLKTYEKRAASAREEAADLWEQAGQAQLSAESGPANKYVERMDECVRHNIDATNLTYEAAYCDNVIALMSNEYVVTPSGAEEKVKADIAAIYDRIDEIINPKAELEAEPEPESESAPKSALYELYAILGLIIGGVFSTAMILIIGQSRLARSQSGQKKATENSDHGEMMDDVNFRG